MRLPCRARTFPGSPRRPAAHHDPQVLRRTDLPSRHRHDHRPELALRTRRAARAQGRDRARRPPHRRLLLAEAARRPAHPALPACRERLGRRLVRAACGAEGEALPGDVRPDPAGRRLGALSQGAVVVFEPHPDRRAVPALHPPARARQRAQLRPAGQGRDAARPQRDGARTGVPAPGPRGRHPRRRHPGLYPRPDRRARLHAAHPRPRLRQGRRLVDAAGVVGGVGQRRPHALLRHHGPEQAGEQALAPRRRRRRAGYPGAGGEGRAVRPRHRQDPRRPLPGADERKQGLERAERPRCRCARGQGVVSHRLPAPRRHRIPPRPSRRQLLRAHQRQRPQFPAGEGRRGPARPRPRRAADRRPRPGDARRRRCLRRGPGGDRAGRRQPAVARHRPGARRRAHRRLRRAGVRGPHRGQRRVRHPHAALRLHLDDDAGIDLRLSSSAAASGS